MSVAHDHWTVLRHGPLVPLQKNLWMVEGTLRGNPLKRVMTIARRSDGQLVIHSGVCTDEDTTRAIEALGPLAYLVVPNGFHRLDAPAFKDRYPDIKVVAPRGSKKAIEKVIAVDLEYDDYPQDEAVRLEYVAGLKHREGVMIAVDDDDTALVANDMLFNMPHAKGLPGFIFRYITGSTGGPRVSRLFRVFMVADKKAFFQDLSRLAQLDGLRRIVVAHHEVIDQEPAAVLQKVAEAG